MKLSLRFALIALAALGNFALTTAQAKDFPPTEYDATEVTVKNVILPLNSTSALVVTACPGCTPRSHAPTATTIYYINKTAVTLEEFRQVVAGKPDIPITVIYKVKSGELFSLTADLPNEPNFAPARRR